MIFFHVPCNFFSTFCVYSMTAIDNLKSKILNIIKDNSYDIEDLKEALDPITDYVNNPSFRENIRSIVDILTKDRNGDNKLTVDDLKMIGNDFAAIGALISAITLIMGSITSLKLQYNEGATEELIFKILAYIFLVVVPKQTGSPLSYEDKKTIVDISVNIYEMIKASQITKDIVNKIIAYFKSKGMCGCCTAQTDAQTIVEQKLPKFKVELMHSMNNVRDKSAMQSEIRSLKRKLKSKK